MGGNILLDILRVMERFEYIKVRNSFIGVFRDDSYVGFITRCSPAKGSLNEHMRWVFRPYPLGNEIYSDTKRSLLIKLENNLKL